MFSYFGCSAICTIALELIDMAVKGYKAYNGLSIIKLYYQQWRSKSSGKSPSFAPCAAYSSFPPSATFVRPAPSPKPTSLSELPRKASSISVDSVTAT